MERLSVVDSRLDRRYIDQLVDIDRICYYEEPYPIFFDLATRKPWLYTVLRRGDDVVGYGLVLPLRQVAFEALNNGEMWEDELVLRDVVDHRPPDGYYLASIASASDANSRERALIVGTTVGPLLRAPKDTIAIAVSESGDRICRMLQMTPEWSSLVIKGLGEYRPTKYFKRAEEINPF